MTLIRMHTWHRPSGRSLVSAAAWTSTLSCSLSGLHILIFRGDPAGGRSHLCLVVITRTARKKRKKKDEKQIQEAVRSHTNLLRATHAGFFVEYRDEGIAAEQVNVLESQSEKVIVVVLLSFKPFCSLIWLMASMGICLPSMSRIFSPARGPRRRFSSIVCCSCRNRC